MCEEDVNKLKKLFPQLTLRKNTVKNTLQRKEETDNAPTNKTEQVTSGMKQGLSCKMFSFFKEIQTINTVLWLFNVL